MKDHLELRMREKSGYFYVYVFRLKGTEFYKIGITDHLRLRLCSVNTSNPQDVECVAYYAMVNRNDANTMEGNLHRLFREKRLRNSLTGQPKEWFILNALDLEIIKRECLPFSVRDKKPIPERLEQAFQYAEYLKRKYIK